MVSEPSISLSAGAREAMGEELKQLTPLATSETSIPVVPCIETAMSAAEEEWCKEMLDKLLAKMDEQGRKMDDMISSLAATTSGLLGAVTDSTPSSPLTTAGLTAVSSWVAAAQPTINTFDTDTNFATPTKCLTSGPDPYAGDTSVTAASLLSRGVSTTIQAQAEPEKTSSPKSLATGELGTVMPTRCSTSGLDSHTCNTEVSLLQSQPFFMKNDGGTRLLPPWPPDQAIGVKSLVVEMGMSPESSTHSALLLHQPWPPPTLTALIKMIYPAPPQIVEMKPWPPPRGGSCLLFRSVTGTQDEFGAVLKHHLDNLLVVQNSSNQHEFYLKILLEDLGGNDEALQYISGLEANQAGLTVKEYGKIIVEYRPAETFEILSRLCTDTEIHNTLLELYISKGLSFPSISQENGFEDHNIKERKGKEIANGYKSSSREKANLGKEDTKKAKDIVDRQRKGLALLKSAWTSEMEGPLYSVDLAIILCNANAFKDGLLFLYEKLKLYKEVISCYKQAHDHEGVIACCKKLGDSSLWGDLLKYFAELGEDCSKEVKDVLTYMEKEDVLPPIVVLQTLSKNPCLMLSVVKDDIACKLEQESNLIEDDRKSINKYQEETELMKREIEDLKTNEKIFQLSKCTACTFTLDLSAIHFMCCTQPHTFGMVLLESKQWHHENCKQIPVAVSTDMRIPLDYIRLIVQCGCKEMITWAIAMGKQYLGHMLHRNVLEGFRVTTGAPIVNRKLQEKAPPIAPYMTGNLPHSCFQYKLCSFVQCENHGVFEFLASDKIKPQHGGICHQLEVFGSGAKLTFSSLYNVVSNGLDCTRHCAALETIISLLPTEKGSSLVSCGFLLKLLRATCLLETNEAYHGNLIKRIATQLDGASVSDLLIPVISNENAMYNVDLISTILEEFRVQHSDGANTKL